MSALNWEELFDEHGRALLLFARQWVGNLADAEDALQEAFVGVFRKAPVTAADTVPLLYQAVKWRAIDVARRRERRSEREDRFAELLMEDPPLFEHGLDHEERRLLLEEAMMTLPEEQKEVLLMKLWGDLTFQQIARALAIPPGTAASRYRYALKALRDRLEPSLIHED